MVVRIGCQWWVVLKHLEIGTGNYGAYLKKRNVGAKRLMGAVALKSFGI